MLSRALTLVAHPIPVTRFWRWLKTGDLKEGQNLVEYSLILCLAVVVLIIGNQAKNIYCNISGDVGA